MKLNRSKEKRLHAQGLTLPEAYGIVWKAGSLALRKDSTDKGTYDDDRYNQQVAERIGQLFTKLDRFKEENSVMKRAMPGGSEPRIDPGYLLFNLPYDQDGDEATMAARSLDLVVGEIYTELINQKLWGKFTPQEKHF